MSLICILLVCLFLFYSSMTELRDRRCSKRLLEGRSKNAIEDLQCDEQILDDFEYKPLFIPTARRPLKQREKVAVKAIQNRPLGEDTVDGILDPIKPPLNAALDVAQEYYPETRHYRPVIRQLVQVGEALYSCYSACRKCLEWKSSSSPKRSANPSHSVSNPVSVVGNTENLSPVLSQPER